MPIFFQTLATTAEVGMTQAVPVPVVAVPRAGSSNPADGHTIRCEADSNVRVKTWKPQFKSE